MSETVNAPDPARLDELAAVTKEYGKYSAGGAGVSLAVLGVFWLAAASLALAGASGWSVVVFALAPAAWFLTVRAARRYYRRYGVVTLSDDELGLGKSGGWLAGFACAVLLIQAIAFGLAGWRWAAAGSPGRWVAYALGVAALLFAARVAPRWTQDTRSGFAAFAVAFAGNSTILSWRSGKPWSVPDVGFVVAVGMGGVVFVAAGVVQHLRYRRLERRLAALKGGA